MYEFIISLLIFSLCSLTLQCVNNSISKFLYWFSRWSRLFWAKNILDFDYDFEYKPQAQYWKKISVSDIISFFIYLLADEGNVHFYKNCLMFMHQGN